MSEPSPRYPVAATSRSQAKDANRRSKKHDHASCDRPPNVPDGQLGSYDGIEGERHGRLRLAVRWNEVTTDSIGNAIRIRKYNLEWQSTKDNGANWRDAGRARVPAKSAGDAGTKAHFIIHKIRGRLGYRWRVQAEATGGCQSDWSTYRDEGEAVETPPPVTNLTLDVDEHACHVSWKIPADVENPDVKDLRITHVFVELFKLVNPGDSPSSGNKIDEDTFRAGEHAHFKLRTPPTTKTFLARARAVSANGATSTTVTTTATKSTPSTPAAPTITFDAQGPRHARFRALVAIAEVADTDFEIKGYRVEFVDKRASGTPTNGTDRDSRIVKAKGASRELAAIFRGVSPDFFTYARTQAFDADHKDSAWSSWAAGGKPSATDSIPALTNITYITARRRVGVKWKVPQIGNVPDDRVALVHVQIATDNGFVSLVDEAQRNAGHGSHRYAIPLVDQGTTFFLRLRPVDGAGNAGGWQPSTTGQSLNGELDDPTSVPPPAAPAPPAVAFDANGTRHARYRAIVTASTVPGDVTRYPIQLAHSVTNGGLTPPAGTRRQHGSVEGDATGDDLLEVFRGIPKRHFVWARERAQNTGGKSAYSNWAQLGQPLNSGITTQPDPPTGVALVVRPRRLIATWDDPDDDEAVRWRVVFKKGPTVMDTQRVRSPRAVYRVPVGDVGLTHTVEVFAINQLGSGIESFGGSASITSSTAEEIAPGTYRFFAHDQLGSGWLWCRWGATYNNGYYDPALYPDLFAVIGYLYGMSFPLFRVPDFSRRGMRGSAAFTAAQTENDGVSVADLRYEVIDSHPDVPYTDGTPINFNPSGSGAQAARFQHTHPATALNSIQAMSEGAGSGHRKRAFQRVHVAIKT